MNLIRTCQCDIPLCAKCLGINCEDDSCFVHTIQNKIQAKERILKDLLNNHKKLNKTEDNIVKFRKEINRLKNL